MQNPSSQFLQDINAASASLSPASREPDEGTILSAIKAPEVKDVASLATKLDCLPRVAESLVTDLAGQGLVDTSNGGLELSTSGERALRYLNIARL